MDRRLNCFPSHQPLMHQPQNESDVAFMSFLHTVSNQAEEGKVQFQSNESIQRTASLPPRVAAALSSDSVKFEPGDCHAAAPFRNWPVPQPGDTVAPTRTLHHSNPNMSHASAGQAWVSTLEPYEKTQSAGLAGTGSNPARSESHRHLLSTRDAAQMPLLTDGSGARTLAAAAAETFSRLGGLDPADFLAAAAEDPSSWAQCRPGAMPPTAGSGGASLARLQPPQPQQGAQTQPLDYMHLQQLLLRRQQHQHQHLHQQLHPLKQLPPMLSLAGATGAGSAATVRSHPDHTRFSPNQPQSALGAASTAAPLQLHPSGPSPEDSCSQHAQLLQAAAPLQQPCPTSWPSLGAPHRTLSMLELQRQTTASEPTGPSSGAGLAALAVAMAGVGSQPGLLSTQAPLDELRDVDTGTGRLLRLLKMRQQHHHNQQQQSQRHNQVTRGGGAPALPLGFALQGSTEEPSPVRLLAGIARAVDGRSLGLGPDALTGLSLQAGPSRALAALQAALPGAVLTRAFRASGSSGASNLNHFIREANDRNQLAKADASDCRRGSSPRIDSNHPVDEDDNAGAPDDDGGDDDDGDDYCPENDPDAGHLQGSGGPKPRRKKAAGAPDTPRGPGKVAARTRASRGSATPRYRDRRRERLHALQARVEEQTEVIAALQARLRFLRQAAGETGCGDAVEDAALSGGGTAASGGNDVEMAGGEAGDEATQQ